MNGPALGRAAATMSGLTAAARVTGFGRVLVVTAVLGTTYLGNTYQAANGVPNVIFELFAAGALHAVLVPTLVGALDAGGRREAERLAGGVLGMVLAGLAVVTVVGMALSPLVMRVLTSGVEDASVRDAQIELGTVLLLVFLPQVLLYGVGLVATGALHADSGFAAPAAAPMANNVVVVAAYGVFWWLHRDAGPWPEDPLTAVEVAVLAGGTTLGVVALTLVPLASLRRRSFRLRPRWLPRDPAVRRLGRHGGWATGQVVAVQGLLIVVLVLANAVAGGVVAFQFGTTYSLLPVALVAIPVTTAVFPTLSRQRHASPFGAVLSRATVAAVALLAPAVAALVALAWPLCRVTAFGQAADAGLGSLATAVAWLAPSALGYGLVLLFTRALYARGDARSPTVVVGAVVALAALPMVVWSPADIEERMAVLGGLQSAAFLVAALLLALVVRRIVPPHERGVLGGVGRPVAAAVVAGLAMAGLVALLDPTSRWASLAVLAVAGGAGAVVYGGVLQVTGPGLRELVRLEPRDG
jgi:putative peptidoglycan lipid II flippase